MTKTTQKITLFPSRDIPFDQQELSEPNVRLIKASVSAEDLAKENAPTIICTA